MRLDSTQRLILLVSTVILIICFSIFPREKLAPTKPPLVYNLDSLLFQKKVIPNRMIQFISLLQSKGIPIQNDYELLLLLSNPTARQNIHQQFNINAKLLLLHAELADLMRIGMAELDAQIFLFSQRNYQNPFTGVTMNLQILAEADAESILEDVGGWVAGNENSLVKNYKLSLEEIENWIGKANDFEFYYFAEFP